MGSIGFGLRRGVGERGGGMKKYRLTDETNEDGLHRIEALIDGQWGPAGTKGGWVESEINLSHEGTCWIGGEAQVSGNAHVSDDALLLDYVRIGGNARVADNARVYGKAEVSGQARIENYAMVADNAWVRSDALVKDFARVRGSALVYGRARVTGRAMVRDAHVYRNAQVWGRVVGVASIAEGALISQSSDYLSIGPLGSRDAMLTVYRTKTGIGAATGCFVGTLDELLEAAKITHADQPQYLHDYERAVAYAREQLG